MSSMISTIQNYLYDQADYRPKPQKNFILENMKRLKQLQLESKEKSKTKTVNLRKVSSKKKKFAIRDGGGGDCEDDKILQVYMNSDQSFQLPVTPETGIQHSFQKSQGSQTLADPREAYREGMIISSRIRQHTPSPPIGMRNTCVQVDGVPKYLSIDEGAMGDVIKNVPLKEDGKVDFVRLNAIIPMKKKKSHEKVDRSRAPTSYQKGVLPKYLKETKKQHIEELQQRGLVEILDEDETSDIICLSEEEKKEHIKKMRKAYANLVSELNTIPMKNDSLKTRARREEIEQALNIIEDGIKMFSRNKLYVKATT